MEPYKIILYLSMFSPLFPIWTGRKSKSVIWYYAFASLIFEITGFVLKINNIPRFWVSNLFFVLEFILISTYFYQHVFEPKYRQQVLIILVMIAVYFVIDTCMHSVLKLNHIGAAMFCGLYIVFCISGLYKVITDVEFLLIERSPLFIFCIAFLIYASGSFIIFLFSSKLLEVDKAFIAAIWKFVFLPINILMNILLGYGLLLMHRTK